MREPDSGSFVTPGTVSPGSAMLLRRATSRQRSRYPLVGNGFGRLLGEHSTALLEKFLLPGTVADIGCGSGHDAAWLADRGWQVSGYDASTAPIEQARRLHPHVRFGHAMLPVLDGVATTFDNVYCDTVIMHRELTPALDAVQRLGGLVCSPPEDGTKFIYDSNGLPRVVVLAGCRETLASSVRGVRRTLPLATSDIRTLGMGRRARHRGIGIGRQPARRRPSRRGAATRWHPFPRGLRGTSH